MDIYYANYMKVHDCNKYEQEITNKCMIGGG